MLGRYELLGALARGGMATVYLARHSAEAGFQRLFAVKVLHDHLADDEDFVSMLLDEARIAALLHHPNVVPIVDVGSQDGIYYVVMEYVEGCSLGGLLKKFRNERPARLIIPIVLDVLAGLQAAHSIRDEDGNLLNLVHRDVSPQNVMIGVDGSARLTDFGIARAESRIMSTRPGQFKGKLAYMAPEQVMGGDKIDRRTDIFAAGSMLWSALTARRLFLADSDAITLSNILQMPIPPPSTIGLKPSASLDATIGRALERDMDKRFQSAEDMEEALREAAVAASCLGSRREVAAWVQEGFGEELVERRKAVRAALDEGRPTLDSIISVSGLMPTVGSFTPSQLDGPTPSSISIASSISGSRPAVPPAEKTRSRVMVGAGIVVGLAVIAGVVLATWASEPKVAESSPAAETGDPAVKPAPTETFADVSARRADPAEETETPAEPAVPATASAKPEPEAQRPVTVARSGSGGVRRPQHNDPAKTAAEQDPVPPPPKKPTRWDKDSPGLPPE
jgi:serine/threonine-protein kinase